MSSRAWLLGGTGTVLAAALLVGVSACSDGGAPEDAAGSGVAPARVRDSLVMASQADAKDLLFVVTQQASDAYVIDSINFSPMDGDFDCKVSYQPQLATSWEWSEDGKSITLRLRDDITWQDGTKVTAEDYKFTYDSVADPKVASPRRDYLDKMVEGARPAIVDATTVRFDFTDSYDRATMLAHVNLPLIPKHLLDQPGVDLASLRSHPLNVSDPVASGPWKVETWKKGEKLVLVPNDQFTGPKQYQPKLNRVILQVIPDYAARLLALENGSVDMMESVLVADADRLRQAHPEISFKRRGYRGMDSIFWNSLDAADYKERFSKAVEGQKPLLADVKPHPIFGDKEVRKALAAAIDVDRLIAEIFTSKVTGEAYARPAVGTITPELCGVHHDELVARRVKFDPTAARARLAELGWTDTNGDGWIDKKVEGNDIPLRFTLLTNAGNQKRAMASAIIQAEMKEIGVEMQIETLDSGTFFDRLRRKDYDVALSGWSAALFVDPSSFWGPTSEFNFTSYLNPRVDELIAQGLAEPDYEKAKPIWRELQEVIYADQPYAFLYWFDDIVAVHSRFQNVTVDLSAPYRKLYQWSVPVDKVKYKN